VDSTFNFLSSTDVQLLNEILTRRNPTLVNKIRHSESVARADAEEIIYTINDEFMNHLDDDWEPTEYGRTVSRLLEQINAVRIQTWPD
jgi:hypothetical protein